MVATSRWILDSGWKKEATVCRGEFRVSIGMLEGSVLTTKQSSMSGSFSPRVNEVLGLTPGYSSMGPVGIPPSSTTWYLFVISVASVPAIVASPVRLK